MLYPTICVFGLQAQAQTILLAYVARNRKKCDSYIAFGIVYICCNGLYLIYQVINYFGFSE